MKRSARTSFDLMGRPDGPGPLKKALQALPALRRRRRSVSRRREIQVRRRDGKEITAELSVTALKTRDGFVFNGFVRDLTDKIAAEDRIRQAEKMEAVGQLTGGIAHDFNNILTVITGTIEILADAVKGEPQLAAITRMIDEAASRGADLTQHLLAFARKQPLRAEGDRRQHADHRHRETAAADARRACRDRIGVRRRDLPGDRRSQSARHRDPQSRAQRPRRHAGRRQADHRDRLRSFSTRTMPGCTATSGPAATP